MKRRVVRHGTFDPHDKKRTLYLLACGHTVSRRTQGWKRYADCSQCDSDVVQSNHDPSASRA